MKTIHLKRYDILKKMFINIMIHTIGKKRIVMDDQCYIQIIFNFSGLRNFLF